MRAVLLRMKMFSDVYKPRLHMQELFLSKHRDGNSVLVPCKTWLGARFFARSVVG